MKFIIILGISSLLAMNAFAKTRAFREIAVVKNGKKVWLPAKIVVHKGDTVKIHAVSKIKNSSHGFAIDAYNIQEVVDEKGKDIQFVADKAGTFPFRCQLHPAHVGGELIVKE